MKIRTTFFAGILAAVFIHHCGMALAKDSNEGERTKSSQNVFYLSEVVVEGEEESVSKVATTDTADRERMNLNGSRNVSDALDTLPGVNLNIGAKNERNY